MNSTQALQSQTLENKRFYHGVFYMCLSAFCIALFGLFNKEGANVFGINVIVFLRFFIPAISILPLLLGTTWKDFQGNIKVHLIRAFFVVLGQYALTYYLLKASILDAILLYNTGPLFIPILAAIFLKKPLSKTTLISVIIGFLGVVFILRPNQSLYNSLAILGLFSGFCMAVSQICMYYVSNHEAKVINLFYLYFISSVISGITLSINILFGNSVISLHTEISTSIYTIVISFFGMAYASLGNQYFRDIAYRRIDHPAILSPFMYIAVIFSGILDWMVYHKTPDIFSIMGASLIFLSAVVSLNKQSAKN